MTPSLGSYLASVTALLAVLTPLAAGSYCLRAWAVPSYSGALARLAELVIGLSLLVVVLELLGSFGLLREGWILTGCILAGAGSALIGWRMAPRGVRPMPVPRVPSWALLVAIAVASVVVAEWSFPSQLNLDNGMIGGDSTWYHGPLAARFAESHSTWPYLFTDPMRLESWFFPATSELLNSVGIILFHSDWLSPLTNLAWVAIGLVAAYCVGRRYGVGPTTLVAAAVALDSGVFLRTQAGEVRNDVVGVALLLAFAALLVNQPANATGARNREAHNANPNPEPTGGLLIAGLAGGLCVSVKLTMLAPVAVTTLLLLVLGPWRPRLRIAVLLLCSEFLTGGYWYLRDLAHTGNPVPLVKRLGPISLPHPNQMPIYPRSPHSLAHYLSNLQLFRAWFFPQLGDALGTLYPVVLALALAGSIYAVVGSRSRVLITLGIAALATMVVYLFTPLTAAGSAQHPEGFFTNTRYLLPGVALGLVLVPLARPLLGRVSARAAALAFLTAVFVVTTVSIGTFDSRYLAGAALLAAVMVWAPAAAGWLRTAGKVRMPIIVLAAVVMLFPVAALGRGAENHYLRYHYSLKALMRVAAPGEPVGIMAWAQHLSHARIAIAGAGELWFDQYIFYGAHTSNWVQYVGQPTPHGGYRVAPSCQVFRNQLNAGHYDYLVMTEFGDNSPGRRRFPILDWTHGEPALRRLRTERASPQTTYLFRVRGLLHPGGC